MEEAIISYSLAAELYGHVQIANALKNFPFIQQFTVVSMAW